MTTLNIPKFGELLAPHLSRIPDAARPGALARLERSAAERYRGWAEALPEHAEGLLTCAAREDEIADRIEAILPVPAEFEALVCEVIPLAVATYYAVFEPNNVWDQMAIQANAERQGSLAWPAMVPAFPEHTDELMALSTLELKSGDFLDALLSKQAA